MSALTEFRSYQSRWPQSALMIPWATNTKRIKHRKVHSNKWAHGSTSQPENRPLQEAAQSKVSLSMGDPYLQSACAKTKTERLCRRWKASDSNRMPSKKTLRLILWCPSSPSKTKKPRLRFEKSHAFDWKSEAKRHVKSCERLIQKLGCRKLTKSGNDRNSPAEFIFK